MPNWCSNYVTFSGTKEGLQQVKELFIKMADQCQLLNKGVQPFDTPIQEDYFFDVYINVDSENNYSYNTKWFPNENDLIQIADKFGVDFEVEFSEMGNGVYGKSIYSNLRLITHTLSDLDLDKVEFSEDDEHYIYNGEIFEVQEEALELILEEKIKLATI